MSTALIILAAGKGSRMQSDKPKVLHELAGAPLLFHALASGETLDPEKTIVVTGHGADSVEAAATDWNPQITSVRQTEQLGTGHAVAQALPALAGFSGNAVVLYGDTPFVSAQTLERLIQARVEADLVVLGFEADDPGLYGRLVMQGNTLLGIKEAKDASPEELAITFCNSGVICADAQVLSDLVSNLSNDNAAGEYYLTDIVALARERNLSTTAITCDEAETLGINTRAELAIAEQRFQDTRRSALIDDGVSMPAPETVFLAFDTAIGRDSIVEPHVVFGPGVTIENGARIRAFSHLEGCHVSAGAIVGPYARLRLGTELGEDVRVGNFVEIKNAQIADRAKINHLSYIGDAQVGERTNIGAGTITCNYDGVFKYQTKIGNDVFVGSNTMLVAPVTVGDAAMTATGTVVTEDIPETALAIGRARQQNKPGLAKKLFDHLRARKAASKKV